MKYSKEIMNEMKSPKFINTVKNMVIEMGIPATEWNKNMGGYLMLAMAAKLDNEKNN